MAKLLCAVGSVAGLHSTGDVIFVGDDNHQFGTHEDLDIWIAAGNAAKDYPGIFYIVSCPDLSVADAQKFLEMDTGLDANGPVINKFRKYSFNVIATERRIGDTRPTLQSSFKITRNYATISNLFILRS